MSADPKAKMGSVARGFSKAKGDADEARGKPPSLAVVIQPSGGHPAQGAGPQPPAHGSPGAYCQTCGKRMPPPPQGQ